MPQEPRTVLVSEAGIRRDLHLHRRRTSSRGIWTRRRRAKANRILHHPSHSGIGQHLPGTGQHDSSRLQPEELPPPPSGPNLASLANHSGGNPLAETPTVLSGALPRRSIGRNSTIRTHGPACHPSLLATQNRRGTPARHPLLRWGTTMSRRRSIHGVQMYGT